MIIQNLSSKATVPILNILRSLFFVAIVLYAPYIYSAVNEKCLTAFFDPKATHNMFYRNFRHGKLNGDKAYFVIDWGFEELKQSNEISLIARIIEFSGPYRMRVERINLFGSELKEVEMQLEIYPRYDNSPYDVFVFKWEIEIRGMRTLIDIMDMKALSKRDRSFLFSRKRFPLLVHQGHPQLSNVFKARRSKRKRLSISEMDLPPLKQEEEKLKTYPSYLKKGLDLAPILIALKEQFIKKEVNPYVTHIDYFAEKIPEHIAYIKQGIISNKDKVSSRLMILRGLEEQAREAVEKHQVTYEWWVKFNLALSKVVSSNYEEIYSKRLVEIGNPRLKRVVEINDPNLNKLISLFPAEIITPTLPGSVGFMLFNRTLPLGIHIVGLVNKPEKVHKNELDPWMFFKHDITHAQNVKNIYYSSPAEIQFHNALMEKIKDLPKQKRKNVEIIYFLFTHEMPFRFGDQSLKNIKDIKPLNYPQSSEVIDPFDKLNKGQKEKRVEQAFSDFIEVVSEIKNE